MDLEPLTLLRISHISNHDMIDMRAIATFLCYPPPSCIVELHVATYLYRGLSCPGVGTRKHVSRIILQFA